MNKVEHIQYWLDSADEDLITAKKLFETKRYLHCLFFTLLHLEKICKALWVKKHKSNYPPKVHNLVYLLEKSNIVIPDDIRLFLFEINSYQLEGRYPEYRDRVYRSINLRLTKENLGKVKNTAKWLKGKL